VSGKHFAVSSSEPPSSTHEVASSPDTRYLLLKRARASCASRAFGTWHWCRRDLALFRVFYKFSIAAANGLTVRPSASTALLIRHGRRLPEPGVLKPVLSDAAAALRRPVASRRSSRSSAPAPPTGRPATVYGPCP
jgi:hypothetical protein